MNWNKGGRYLLSIVSGILMVLSFPFTGSMSYVMLLAWVPLLIVEKQVSEQSYRSGKVFIHAYLAFLIYNIGSTWWIWNSSEMGAVLAFGMNTLIMATVFYLFHLCKRKLGRNLGYLAFVAFWMAFEMIHYHWELSWPWLNLGNVFAIVPENVQWYTVTGVLGGTLWILLANLMAFSLLEAFTAKKERGVLIKKGVLFVSLIAVPIIISRIMYQSFDPEQGTPAEVVVTQPNVDPYNEKFSGSVTEQLDRICDLADGLVSDQTAFVLAPETALPFSFYEDEIKRIIYYPYLVERKAKWKNASMLIGASTKKYFRKKRSRASKPIYGGPGYEEFYNSSLLIDEYDQPTFVHKSKLVLGVEKVPFSNWFPALEKLSINNGGTSGTLGIEEESQVLRSRKTVFAPIVCYESIYGGFVAEQCRKGAELLFIITNDGWWDDTPGYKQHQALARLRALETRKYLARSANTGSSCFIDPRGGISQQTPWWTETAIKKTLYRNDIQTLYVRWGDYLGKLAIYLSIALLLVYFFRRVKPQTSK